MVKITFTFSASVIASTGSNESEQSCRASYRWGGRGRCHQSSPHTMTGLFAAAVVAVAEQLGRPPTVHVHQLTCIHSHIGLPPAGRACCLWLQSGCRLVYFVILNEAIKAVGLGRCVDIKRYVIIGKVTITGVNAFWLLQAVAGDKNLCDNKRIVILSDVILSGFDCTSFCTLLLYLLDQLIGKCSDKCLNFVMFSISWLIWWTSPRKFLVVMYSLGELWLGGLKLREFLGEWLVTDLGIYIT